jgi:hypothetical protein
METIPTPTQEIRNDKIRTRTTKVGVNAGKEFIELRRQSKKSRKLSSGRGLACRRPRAFDAVLSSPTLRRLLSELGKKPAAPF